ncbi:MAG: triose-phosphate isomerase [Rhodospirillales bacterium]|mgnify:CR=1 FL=1
MSTTRRPLIAGNWKMNGLRATAMPLAGELATKMNNASPATFEMLVCPPAILVESVVDIAAGSDLAVGGQDCHMNASGAHTGDVSAQMLKDIGCSHVIVGHSERRADHAESDEIVCAKAEAALSAGLIAIVCVGETEAERDKGITIDVVAAQIAGSVPDGANSENTVVAYEPVWAIGTGRTPTSEEVQEVHATMRKTLGDKFGVDEAEKTRLLYGGSVKPSNAVELMGLADVDGALVGGASLSHEDFWAIAESCPK